jgi:eukaryotic-like serine/threonine-protein kinase
MVLIEFLKSRLFLKHFGLLILVTIVLITIFVFFMKSFTDHGKTVTLGDLTGLYYDELDNYALKGDFDYIVVDSVYDENKEKGTIVAQDPLPGSKVKSNRTIYLTVIAKLQEQIEMPNLVDLSLRQARSIIENYGLKIASLEYKPDIGTDVVLAQKYKGSTIEPGTRINKGSGIVLVLSAETNAERVSVPFIIGMKRDDAIIAIHANSLNVGREIYEDSRDTSKVRVYIQSPKSYESNLVPRGQKIDIWYRSPDKINFNDYVKRYKADSLSTTNEESE